MSWFWFHIILTRGIDPLSTLLFLILLIILTILILLGFQGTVLLGLDAQLLKVRRRE